ncbi:MAG: RrF2 family transcriptional regulator [Acidobacteriota bacterium]
MHVNQAAQYALRAMMHLASVPAGTPVRARDLSRITGVPGAYLSKILHRLVARGLLRASKGHGGGFILARRPARVRLLDVFEAAGGSLERDLCVFGSGRCDAASPCPLHQSWTELNDAFYAWSSRTTLADLTGRPARGSPRGR